MHYLFFSTKFEGAEPRKHTYTHARISSPHFESTFYRRKRGEKMASEGWVAARRIKFGKIVDGDFAASEGGNRNTIWRGTPPRAIWEMYDEQEKRRKKKWKKKNKKKQIRIARK